MIKKIAILTSGGDAPGMNAAIVGAIRTGYRLGKQMYVVKDGFRGLFEDTIIPVSLNYGEGEIASAGTMIKTKRLNEFKEEAIRQVAVTNLKKRGIEALIVIGGDGSYMGAKKLSEMGIACIAIPGTIDNDIASTDITIGFDTALNTIVDSLDKIVSTMSSHNRCVIVEVMGNNCPDLTLYAGLATNADMIFTIDRKVNVDELIRVLNEKKAYGQDHVLIIVAEKLTNVDELCKTISERTSWDTRRDVLGYIQRGGAPSAMERFNGIRLGSYAIELIDKGITGACVGIIDNKLTYHDIYEALEMPRKKHEELYHVFDLVK